jgi:hypothetical protein
MILSDFLFLMDTKTESESENITNFSLNTFVMLLHLKTYVHIANGFSFLPYYDKTIQQSYFK